MPTDLPTYANCPANLRQLPCQPTPTALPTYANCPANLRQLPCQPMPTDLPTDANCHDLHRPTPVHVYIYRSREPSESLTAAVSFQSPLCFCQHQSELTPSNTNATSPTPHKQSPCGPQVNSSKSLM
uniref:Uncharacterized protein n=1 Tax=Knipowitschia caucasica TaxID=637954 RepID=A0AAV2LCH4_KNICA